MYRVGYAHLQHVHVDVVVLIRIEALIMGVLKKLALTTAVLTVALACFLYTPIPDGYSKPWTVHISLSSVRLVKKLTSAGEMLGWTEHGVKRYLFDVIGQAKVRDDENMQIVDTEFDGVPVRTYTPKGKSAKSPGFVYYHGGGWHWGSVLSHDPLVRKLAKELNIVIVSVEYRRTPEHMFPAAFDDCVTATKFFLKNAADFGVDPTRVGIGGDSAGGHMAATVSMKLRDDKLSPRNKLQLLFYPVTQMVDLMTPSYQANAWDPFFLDISDMEMYLTLFTQGHRKNGAAFVKNEHTSPAFKKQVASSYMDVSKLPKELISEDYVQPRTDYGDEKLFAELKDVLLSPYVSPLLVDDLSGLPKAYVLTCQHDVLRDDGIWYAQRLKEAGVEVTHKHLMLGYHGILAHSGMIPESGGYLAEIIEYIKINL